MSEAGRDSSYRSKCPFFLREDLSAAEQLLKSMFCGDGRPENCEIHHLIVAGKPVPDNMLPDGSTSSGEEQNSDDGDAP